MTRLDAIREIVSAFDAVAQEHSETADEFERQKHRCRAALMALGLTDDEIDEATGAAYAIGRLAVARGRAT